MLNLDRPCPHPDFTAMVTVNRLTGNGGEVTAYVADITVVCAACDEPFRWVGVPAGFSGGHPTVSVTGTELRAPLRPASSDPDFGLGIPGFSIRQVV
jgi:hypothetical protein